MNLEKATSHSSEAGLAGWISSNDVTLFTVVVVVGVALFLQANVIRGSRANARLEDEKLSLTSRNLRTSQQLASAQQQLVTTTAALERTHRELEDATRKLEAAQRDLLATRQERDRVAQERRKLDEQLLAAIKQVEGLRADLDKLAIDKSNLIAESEKLKQEKGDVTKEKDTLAQAKAMVEANLADLAAKLQQRLKEVDDLQKERDLLDQQAKALTERVQKLELQLGDSEKSLADVKKTSEAELADLKELLAKSLERHKADQATSAQDMQATVARATEAEAAAKQASTQAADYLSRLRQAATLFKTEDENKKLLQLQIAALKTQLANALDDMQQMRRREVTLNRELIGLRGGLRRVAILFDSSGSMLQSGRWDEVHKIANTWLDHLEVDECVLIVFSSGVTTYPSDGSLLRVSGQEGEANRRQMSDFLKAVKPEGWTNTMAAMQTAYRYPNLDTIILFSDGAPTIADSGRFDPEAAKQIYQLCQQHASIPVNAIGLGNYFDPDFSTFLRTVAQLTNGTFVGR